MFKTKAAVLYEANKPLQIDKLNQEEPRHGEVRVRTSVAGICASDHHYMKGELKMPMPVVLGHEGSGIVEKTGSGVTTVKNGDHVVLHWRPSAGISSSTPKYKWKGNIVITKHQITQKKINI